MPSSLSFKLIPMRYTFYSVFNYGPSLKLRNEDMKINESEDSVDYHQRVPYNSLGRPKNLDVGITNHLYKNTNIQWG